MKSSLLMFLFFAAVAGCTQKVQHTPPPQPVAARNAPPSSQSDAQAIKVVSSPVRLLPVGKQEEPKERPTFAPAQAIISQNPTAGSSAVPASHPGHTSRLNPTPRSQSRGQPGGTAHALPIQLWERYKKHLCHCPSVGLSLDISRMDFPDDYFARMSGPINKAFAAMDALESGAIANPDENRMVGHYWLRDPQRAPTPELRKAITDTLAAIKQFAAEVHAGKIKSESNQPFLELLIIGIGGSALGPQFVADALTTPRDKMRVHFFDNTDPDGMERTLSQIEDLPQTLTVVISKSGGTKETRNGQLVAKAAYEKAGLNFAKHAVAITGENSKLDQTAKTEGWLTRFPMWDWVGGRTSELSAVGLLPAALQGIDIDAILAGARDTDFVTRMYDAPRNPAALLALMWFHAETAGGDGQGKKDMVVLPYKDRLLLFSRYLQQLVMESLGKEKDLDGKIVHQGIAVYGNKGSTDQHAYVQQLRDGINNFFVTFIEVLQDPANLKTQDSGLKTQDLQVEPDATCGDFLHGFFQGTRSALHENHRQSLTITIDALSPRAIGILIALFERAVGLYGQLINVNAYHQPGVEAGKIAAESVLKIQRQILAHLRAGHSGTPDQIAAALNLAAQAETVQHTLRHLAANGHAKTAQADKLTEMIYSK